MIVMPKKKIPKLIKVTIYLIVIYMICWGIAIALLFSGTFPPNVYERSRVDLISFSSDGSKLISCDNENIIQIWDISSGEELYRLNWRKTTYITSGPTDIEWLQDKEQFAVMDGKNIRIYNTSNHTELWNDSGFNSIDASQSGDIFANINGIWSATNYSQIKKFNLSSPKSIIDLSPNGKELIYLPYGNELEIINTSDGKTIHNLQEIDKNIADIVNFYDFGWSIDETKIGLLVDFRNEEGIVYYEWETDNYSLIMNKTFLLSRGYADLSPDFSKYVYANPRTSNVSIIHILYSEPNITLEFSKWISTVKWSPDGSLIAAGNNDGIIKVWDATSGELIQTMMTPKDHRIPT